MKRLKNSQTEGTKIRKNKIEISYEKRMVIKPLMARPVLNKKPVKIYLNKRLYEASREIIPNLSHFVETKILELLYALNHPIAREYIVDRWGFEPQASRMPSERSSKLSYRPFCLPSCILKNGLSILRLAVYCSEDTLFQYS